MKVTVTKIFKKNFKKIKKDKKLNFIFEDEITLNEVKATRWEYVLNYCFLKGNDFPQYFNNHQIHIAARTKKILAKKLGTSPKNISCLELHLNGQNGNCLLVYSKNDDEVLLINIGTHNQVFKNL